MNASEANILYKKVENKIKISPLNKRFIDYLFDYSFLCQEHIRSEITRATAISKKKQQSEVLFWFFVHIINKRTKPNTGKYFSFWFQQSQDNNFTDLFTIYEENNELYANYSPHTGLCADLRKQRKCKAAA